MSDERGGRASARATPERYTDRLARLAGLGMTLFGLASIGELWWNALPLWDESGPGPAFAPGLLAAVLAVLGLVLASGRVVNAPDEGEDEEERPLPGSMISFTLLLAALILCFPYLGGVLSLSLFVTAEMLLVERSTLRSALISGAVAFALIWIVFIRILMVPLPAGLLAFLG